MGTMKYANKRNNGTNDTEYKVVPCTTFRPR